MKKLLSAKFLCLVLVVLLASQAAAAPKKKARRVSSSSSYYNTLTDWRLDDKFRPSVTLNLVNGRSIVLVFERQGERLVLSDRQGLIPEGTRFTVPANYMAYCNHYHTECLSGRASRIEDSDGTVMTQFEQGAKVEYLRDSGLTMVSYASIASSRYSAANTRNGSYYKEDDYDYDYEPVRPSRSNRMVHEYENRSVNPEDVIKTYGLSQSQTIELINRHNEALKLRSNREKAEVYAHMYEENPDDYLAAYYAALANLEMRRGGQSLYWCDKALEINNSYYPAKVVRKRAQGIGKM